MQKQLVVVAQKAGAKIFESLGGKSTPLLLESLDNPTGRMKDQEIMPGHLTEGHFTAHPGTSAVSAKKSPAEIEVDKFIKKLSDRIEILAQDNLYKSVALVAEPKTLGKIKEHLGAHAAKKLGTTIHKDIALLSEAEIKEHLAGLI
jgi:protein required for attachment to host cells